MNMRVCKVQNGDIHKNVVENAFVVYLQCDTNVMSWHDTCVNFFLYFFVYLRVKRFRGFNSVLYFKMLGDQLIRINN